MKKLDAHGAAPDLKTLTRRGRSAGTIGLTMLAMFLGVGRVSAQRELTSIPDSDPELERRTFQVADGFEVNLFASDPQLAKPIQMNFDPAGRLWVACSEVYPQIKPSQKANDKIIILEDRDGDGKADKTTVFADGLLIPTGVAPGDGGAYVGHGTELLHLADTRGQGRADRRRVVLSGFGTEDTHHIVHTLRWGDDGMLYFNQSIYIHSHIETPYGVRQLNGGGIWQLRPETGRLEVYARGFINPWGHQFDRWGQSFVVDGAGGEGINYIIPGASYATAVGAARVVAGLNPGSPKYCGEEILSGRHLPDDWQGNILTNDFRGHRVCRFVIREDGAGYAAQVLGELIKTNHAAFRPVDVKMGPDGAIYIADWYNPIIQHGEVDFRDPRRDHVHGRIWRVTAKGRPLVKRPALVEASTEALLESLKAPEQWTRQQAKRVLKERGARVVPALAAWVRRLQAADADYEHALLEALWTYQSLDVVEPGLLASALHARDHHVRAAATRVVGYWQERLPNALELLAARVADDHPQVRLEAVRALAKVPDARAVELAMQALDHPMDKFLDYGVWLCARDLEPSWVPALRDGRLDFGGSVRHLIFALQAVGSRDAIRPLVELLKSGKLTGEREESVLALVAALGGPQELGMVFDRILTQERRAVEEQTRLLEALAQAAQERGVRPAGDLSRISRLLSADNEALRAVALRLVGQWHQESLRSPLVENARSASSSAVIHQAALDGLVLLGGPASRDVLEQLCGSDRPMGLRRQAVIALAKLDLQAGAARAVEVLAASTDSDPTEMFSAFLERKEGAAALASALANHQLPADVAKTGVRTARMSGRDVSKLVTALSTAGNLSALKRNLTSAEMQALVAEVLKLGDAARGEAVFRRRDQSCIKCHAIAGAGGQVGPDLASIGASAPVDYLIDSLLVPNKAVKEGYHSLVVTTTDGRLLTGIKVRETKTDLVLRTVEDKEVAIPLQSIDERANGGSLMPEGLVDPLTHAELMDLVRFLSELGKVGPYSVSKARLVRSWQVAETTPATQQVIQRTGFSPGHDKQMGLTWSPAYSQVSGTLPLDSVPRAEVTKGAGPMGLLRCRLDVSTGGKVKMILNSAVGLHLWLDGTSHDAAEQMVLDLPPGAHTLTLAINLAQRHEGVRCELEDVSGSPARVQIVAAK